MLIKSNNSNDELTDIVSKEYGYEVEISFDPKNRMVCYENVWMFLL